MNQFHRWYCRSGHWRRTVRERLFPWVLDGVELRGRVLEIGPGPGITTDLLAALSVELTAVEIDPDLASRLRRRLGSRIQVVEADATHLPFPDDSFDAAVCFTMLHHVPSPSLQDKLFGEVRRVLKPTATFAGSDSVPSPLFRLAHIADTMVPVDPNTLPARLAAAGFSSSEVRHAPEAFCFRAR